MSDLSAYNWLTIHAQELICFDSNTPETMKKQLYPSDSSNFPSLHWKNPAKGLQAFTWIMFLMQENDVTQSNVKETKWHYKTCCSLHHVLLASELLQNKTQFFSIAYIGVLC